MTAGITTLDLLEEKKDQFTKLNGLGDSLREQLNNLFESTNKNYIASNYGSLIFISALQKNPWKGEEIAKLDIMNNIDQKEQANLQLYLLNRNIYGYHGLGSLSFLHTKKDTEFIISIMNNLCK